MGDGFILRSIKLFDEVPEPYESAVVMANLEGGDWHFAALYMSELYHIWKKP